MALVPAICGVSDRIHDGPCLPADKTSGAAEGRQFRRFDDGVRIG